MPTLADLKNLLEATEKVPYRFLILLPSILALIISGILVYLNKAPALYVGAAILGAAFFVVAIRNLRKSGGVELSSSEWFRRIERKLRDCGSAKIYLRKFDHPDNFKSEHRGVLLRMMSTIKEKIDGGSQITIIAYHPNPNEKSGRDWLQNNCIRPAKVEKLIIIRTSQPTTNSSSIYIFDDRTCFYNKTETNKIIYREENFASSIVYELITRGYANLVGGDQ